MRRPRQPERALEVLQHHLLPVAAREQVALQGQRRVLLRHRHQVALASALGRGQLHPPAPALGEPLAGQLRFRQGFGEQDLARRRDVLRVELAHERGEHLPVAGARDAVEEEGLPPEQPALAHEEELHARLRALAHDAHHVLVLLLGGDHLLPLAHGVERLHPVAQHRGALELHLLRGGLHLPGEASREVVALALQEALHVLHGGRVALAGLPAGAGRVAAVDVVLQARPRQGAVDLDAARAEREQLPHQPERLAHRGGGIERPEVARPVLLHPPGHHQPRELLVGRELEERIVLVVAEDDVVAGPVLLDQRGLEDHRLELVGGDDVLEVPDVADEGVGLGIAGAGLLEVRADTAPQRGRLADVDDLALGVLVEVDPGPVRDLFELRREGHPPARADVTVACGGPAAGRAAPGARLRAPAAGARSRAAPARPPRAPAPST